MAVCGPAVRRPLSGISTSAMFAQAAFHHGEENAQHRALQGCIALKEIAQPLGQLYSLIETSKANGIDPYRYLVGLFRAIPLAKSADDYEALLPWRPAKSVT